jgi:hypothetical protein
VPLEHHLIILYGLLTCEDRHANASTGQLGIHMGQINHATCQLTEDELVLQLDCCAQKVPRVASFPETHYITLPIPRGATGPIIFPGRCCMKWQNKQTEPCVSAGLYCLFGMAGRAPLRSGTLTVQARFISRAEHSAEAGRSLKSWR